MTNLSTEQMVGLNGAAYIDGLAVMAWEVIAVIALVAMALFFLPRFLKYGVTTVPEYLEIRFDHQTQVITNLLFLSAYALILLPIILYTGASGLMGILDIQGILGFESREPVLWLVVWTVGIIGSLYALFGGLRTVAVSDTINGIGLLVGGFMIAWFSLVVLGDGDPGRGLLELAQQNPERLNSIGNADNSVPFSSLFSGVLLLHFFYWTSNQQIIQRTFGAKSLAEGQKGVIATGMLKLFGPMYLVLPGIIAYTMFPDLGNANADQAYGMLVNRVLPSGLVEFSRSGTGAMVKRLHMGRAAEGGILASSLAASGFTGPVTVLEGECGFLKVFCNEWDISELTRELGSAWVSSRLSMKRFACHTAAHKPVQAILDLKREQGLKASDVASITIEVGEKELRRHNIPEPADVMMAQYSVPFCVALALTSDPTDPRTFRNVDANDPAVRALCGRIKLVPWASPTRPTPIATITTVYTTDRRELRAMVSDFKGTPDNPLNRAELRDKFLKLTRDSDQAGMARLFDRLQSLDEEKTADWISV